MYYKVRLKTSNINLATHVLSVTCILKLTNLLVTGRDEKLDQKETLVL